MKIRILTFLTSFFVSFAAWAAPGAIWTSYGDGKVVNGNVYPSKLDVYLNGGPQNVNGKGLPDGLYYFQVTNPSGKDLLSQDDISCRAVRVTGGKMVGAAVLADEGDALPGQVDSSCSHNNGDPNASNGSTPVQLCKPGDPSCADYLDTTNDGGEYKVWLTKIADYDPADCPLATHGFCHSNTKTDNFKVRKQGAGYIVACKFNDMDGNGAQDPGEPTLSDWPISATGVDNSPATLSTDAFGCVSFTVSDANSGKSVTVTEGTLGNLWTQSALIVNEGDGDVSIVPPTLGITRTVAAGDTLEVDFGNTNPDCTEPGTCGNPNCILTGTCPEDEPGLEVKKDANPSYKVTWKISKSADTSHIETASTGTVNYSVTVEPDKIQDIKVTGKIHVTNLTIADAHNVTVTDSVDNGGDCSVTGGATTVPAGQTVDFDYTCTYSGSSLPAVGTNTAVATWVPDNAPDLIPLPSATGTAPVDFASATVTDGTVTVNDSLKGPLTPSATYPNSKTYTYALDLTGEAGKCVNRPNTATFTTNTTGTTGSAGATVEVCTGADLTVSKTVNTTFTRTYAWKVTKTADKTRLDAGGTVTYTIVAEETGWTDSAWSASGTITVTNPNLWQDVTFNLSDAIGSTGCTITGGGSNLVVNKNSSRNIGYTCPTLASGAAFVNTATASWNSTTFHTPTGSGSGTANGSFVTPTTRVNQTITVTDILGSTIKTLGTLTATDEPPLTSQTYTDPRTLTPPGSGCTNVTNTAKIVNGTVTLSTSSVTIPNCSVGGLTMGFWQNSNGQGVIKNSASTGGVCNLTAWLRGSASGSPFGPGPFQDTTLPANASCSTVATYVGKIVNVSDCSSGGTCNAMLKAQMLATALDVYFTDPALGGTSALVPKYTSAGAPIGGVLIDLTNVQGKNLSGAFGGAASMTVMQMLAYAAGQSNGTGSAWYLQVKATQVMAKDAFDAINNSKVVSP